MVNWTLNFGTSEVKSSEGKLILVTPCLINFQQELLWDLQNSISRFSIASEDMVKYKQEVPKLVVKHLLNLDGCELQDHFASWLELLRLDINQVKDEIWKKLIPKEKEHWYGVSLDKKIALFSGASIIAKPFSFLFLANLHLENNSQTFLFNFLKSISSTHRHQLIVTWTYRLQIPNTTTVFFKGFGTNAA